MYTGNQQESLLLTSLTVRFTASCRQNKTIHRILQSTSTLPAFLLLAYPLLLSSKLLPSFGPGLKLKKSMLAH